MDQNFVSILYNLSKKFTYVSCVKKTVGSLTKKSIESILNSYDLDSYCFSLDNDFKFSIFCEDIINYLLALSYSIHVAKKYYKKPLILLDKRCGNHRNDLSIAYNLFGSPYIDLVLSLKSDEINIDDVYVNNDDDNDVDIDPMDKEYAIEKLPYRSYSSFEYQKPLKYLACSIYKNILYCPYSVLSTPPTKIFKKDGTVDKRNKLKSSNDFSEYKKESGKHVVTPRDIYESDDYIMPKLFTKSFLENVLSLGGPLSVEFFHRQRDITYKNTNIENILNSRHFFTKTYKDAINDFKEEDTRSSDSDLPLKLFNFYALETILNGSFIFEFCNIFSGNSTTKFIEKLSSIDNDYIDPLKEIFVHMNRIENPFIKYRLLQKIVDTSDSLYIYLKDDTALWVKNICKLCDELANFEQVIYEKFLSSINWDLIIFKTDDRSNVCKVYYDLFFDCKIWPSDSPGRGERYRDILINITIINFKHYYPISDHRLFHTD